MDTKEFEKVLARAVQKGVHSNLERPVYIASGFFNESQNAILTELEQLLEAQGINFISPRREGVVNKDSPMRSTLMGEIFDQNIRNIKESGKCYFLLDRTMGGTYDMGTLFELGYALTNYFYDETKNVNDLIFYTSSEESKETFEEIKENIIYALETLKSECKYEVGTKVVNLVYKDNASQLSATVDFLYKDKLTPSKLESLLGNVKKFIQGDNLLLIDNRPYQISILAGVLYGTKTKFRTCSFKGFESNIMISKAAEGHINLPGFYDPATNPNSKIL